MSNVRCLVRVNARMLNQDLAGWHIRGCPLISGEGSRQPAAVDSDIQISRRSDLHLGNAFDRAYLPANRFRNLQRRRAQWLGKREQRNGEIPELHLWRLL